tara:strand:+ start:388 stop:1239 length:852 start_codon:yes stop_codon:yes gene_type:complete
MSKNIVYIINNLPSDTDFANPGYRNVAWVPHCLKSLENYVAKIGADLRIISMADYPGFAEIENYNFSFYQKSTFIKILFLHDFMETDYEKFALLDLDMVVHKDAPDIFAAHEEDDFVMGYGFHPVVVKKNEIFLKKYLKTITTDENVYWHNQKTNRQIPKYNLNLGCYIMGRPVVEKMTSVLPNQHTMVDFLKVHNLIDNPLIEIDGEKKDFIDQDLYSYAYTTTDVLTHHKPLQWVWNANYQACFEKGRDFNLCHLCGEDGKEFLLDNLDNPEVMDRIDVQS